MARPKKENADYHTHDKDMRNDPKIRALRKRFKHEGYAIYNMMLELLTDSDNWRYEWNALNIELLSADFDTDKLEEIINYCSAQLGLFTIDNGYIFSLQHQKRFIPLLSKRKRDNERVIAVENTHSKVEYSKVEESKIKEGVISGPAHNSFSNNGEKENTSEKGMLAAEFVPPSWEQVNNYFFTACKNFWDSVKSGKVARKFYNHYTTLGWKTTTGAAVLHWQSKAEDWITTDREKERNGKSVHVEQKSKIDESKVIMFIESVYQEYLNGTIVESGIPADFYEFLKTKELLLLSDEEVKNVFSRCKSDPVASKKKSVAEYFERLKRNGVEVVFQLQK